MNSVLIWLHPDCLSATNPAFAKYPDAEALFVFDEEEIKAEGWTLKRIQFLYETLLELPCAIDRGDVAAQIASHLRARGLTRVVTVDSVNPRTREQIRRLQVAIPVEVLPAPAFVDYRGSLDLKRFARYWKRVEPILFDK